MGGDNGRFYKPMIAVGIFGLAVGLLAGLNVLMTGSPAAGPFVGVVDDWTHHHVVFSNPGTAAAALGQGKVEQWYRMVNDSRYQMQQIKRSPALASAPDYAARMALLGAPTKVGPTPVRIPVPRMKKDWNINLGAGGTVGSGNYPAKFSFNSTPACSDFAVFNTSLAGAAAQATVMAFTNLYAASGCGSTIPSVAWAYNTTTGDRVETSVVLSLTGKQMAFISTDGTHGYLDVLQFANGQGTAYNTPVSPTPSTTGGNYSTCRTNTPNGTCLLRMEFANAANDTTSSPFYDYASDTLWVGDVTGKVHKFTGVFNGSPAESGNPWASVGAATALASIVYDGTSIVYVGGANGVLYHISSTAVVTASGALAGGKGINDGALVDPIAGEVYVVVGTDTEGTAHPGVYRLPTNFAAGATGSEIALTQNAVNVAEYMGTFDNIYYANDASGTTQGNLFVCFYDQNADYLLSFPVANFPTPTGINNTYGSYTQVTTAATSCSPITEVVSGGTDWVFLSVATNASFTTGGASTCTAALGCLYNFNIGNGTTLTFATNATPTAGFPIAAGSGTASSTSGIVVDYTAAPGNNIYFTTNATGTGSPCAPTTQGCAIQVTQAAP